MQRLEEQRGSIRGDTPQQVDGMRDLPDQSARDNVRAPTRSLAGSVAVDPRPVPRDQMIPNGRIVRRGCIVQPGMAMQMVTPRRIGGNEPATELSEFCRDFSLEPVFFYFLWL